MKEINWHPNTDIELNTMICRWLSFCLAKLQEGREREIPKDPFYKSSRGKLTDDYCDRVIQAIDKVFEHESLRYPDYHEDNSGSSIPPDFSRFSRASKRALVEGLDRLMGYRI